MLLSASLEIYRKLKQLVSTHCFYCICSFTPGHFIVLYTYLPCLLTNVAFPAEQTAAQLMKQLRTAAVSSLKCKRGGHARGQLTCREGSQEQLQSAGAKGSPGELHTPGLLCKIFRNKLRSQVDLFF